MSIPRWRVVAANLVMVGHAILMLGTLLFACLSALALMYSVVSGNDWVMEEGRVLGQVAMAIMTTVIAVNLMFGHRCPLTLLEAMLRGEYGETAKKRSFVVDIMARMGCNIPVQFVSVVIVTVFLSTILLAITYYLAGFMYGYSPG